MRNSTSDPSVPGSGSFSRRHVLLLAAILAWPSLATAATPNWVAYNDHRQGGGTASRVTTYSLGVSGGSGVPAGGPLTDFNTGLLISPNQVGVVITSVGNINGVAGTSTAPYAGSPMDQLFGGKIDWSSSALYFAPSPYNGAVTVTFTNLTPGMRYSFRGAGLRGNNYPGRWTLASLAGAAPGALPAHLVGTGSPGIVTNGWSPFGDSLAPFLQAAWNSGENRAGDVIGWDEIEPINNSFSVICSNYHAVTATSPSGPLDSSGNTYCYAFNAFILAETALGACTNPIVVTSQPTNLTVAEFKPFTLSVMAEGCITNYQWYKNNQPILGADARTYTVGSASFNDAGNYHVHLQGPVNNVLSSTNLVAVLADTNPPSVVRAVGRPHPANQGWDQVVVTFSEAINPDDAQNPDNYLVAVNGNPSDYLAIFTIVAIDATNVLLNTTQRAPLTDYIVTLSNIRDRGVNQNLIGPPGDTVPVEAEVRLMQMEAAPPETAQNWRYHARGNDLGTAWRAADYDDSTWTSDDGTAGSGPGPLDAKRPPRQMLDNGLTVGTVLPEPVDPDMRTRYFRTHIYVPARPQDVRLQMFIVVDDGAVFYVNGREAFRHRLPSLASIPANAMSYGVAATNISEPAVEGPFELPATNLVAGDNVIAVEVHQATASSTDATLGMVLRAFITHYASGPVVFETQPQGGTIVEGQSYTFNASANGGLPLTCQWYHDHSPIAGATNTIYAIALANTNHSGDYHIVMANPQGAVTSLTAHLSVIVDNIPPSLLAAFGGWPDSQNLQVSFSKNLAPASVQNLANYRLIGPGDLQITDVIMNNGSNVILWLNGPRQANVNYLLEVKDLSDTAYTPNRISPNPSTVPVATLVELVPMYGHTWKYLHQSGPGEPAPCLDGAAWTTPLYDDSAWPSGQALFYGARSNNVTPIVVPAALDPLNPETSIAHTVLNLFTNAVPLNAVQEVTYYFRTTFDLPAETNGVNLYLHSYVDDGAIFYLNGNRVADWRMAGPLSNCTSFADQTIGQAQWNPSLISTGRMILLTGLKSGRNTLAVEVHQSDATSSDVAFGAVLVGSVLSFTESNPPLGQHYDPSGRTLSLSWTAGSGWELYQAASVLGPWVPSATNSPCVLTNNGGAQFFRLQKNP